MTYDTQWQGVTNANYRILVNGAVLASGSGAGTVAWHPATCGTYTLTYQAFVDDMKVGEDMSATFTLAGKDFANAEISLSSSALLYDGTAQCPKVAIVYQSETLVEGMDYTLEYENNVNPGVATVTIRGKGRFSDVLEKNFKIEPAGICSLDLTTDMRTARPTEEICFDQGWFDGDGETVEIRIAANDDVLFSTTGDKGLYTWYPSTPGDYQFQLRHYMDGYVSGEVLTANFVVENYRVATPIITPESLTFQNASQEVTIECNDADATILYTTDGSDPLVNGRVYKHGFTIYQTSTVRAVAVKDGWWRSIEAQSALSRGDVLGEAAGFLSKTMETGESDAWVVDAKMSSDGSGASLKSATPTYPNVSFLKTSVSGAGTLSFWWRARCENPADGEYYDYCAFLVGGVETAKLAGNDTGWVQFVTNITTTGKHVLRWEYRKDDEGDCEPDCAWVDHVQWIPANGTGFTMTTPEQVPYSWITQYGGKPTDDYEKIGNSYSGKTWGGKATKMWEEYIAGTDPTNDLSVLQATIEMVGTSPIVKWLPDLNEGGTKNLREYHVWGSTNLVNGGDWECPTNSLHRFFKVTVEMP